MKKKVIVLSLGGSLIIPNEIDVKFLKKFKEIIKNNIKNYKFVIVCGGGSIARKYISALKEIGFDEDFQNFSGISATRMNARFMSYFFGIDPKKGIPHTLKTVKSYIKRRNLIFCGALDYKPNQTSDSTAAEIARYFKAEFINLTNVPGLYNKDPKKHKNTKFISKISWQGLFEMANEKNFKPGQHFVIDQTAAKTILEKKIKTYILGKDLKQLDNLLKNKTFKGTIIFG